MRNKKRVRKTQAVELKPLPEAEEEVKRLADERKIGVTNKEEDRMASFLDELALFRVLQPNLRKALLAGDAKEAFNTAVPIAVARLIELIEHSRSDAARLGAIKDLLDRAGLKPVEKSAILGIDPSQMTPGELSSTISSLLYDADLVEVEDLDESKDEETGAEAED